MDVTFVLEESGVTATVEVPCEADVAAAKEVACTALAVSPASVEMRIGTQVLEGTCRLQDTAFDAGVQVVLARPRLTGIKCPAECYVREGVQRRDYLSLSRCGTLCVYSSRDGHVGGFDTETFDTVFSFEMDALAAPAISQCKTRLYLSCGGDLYKVALPGGEVLRRRRKKVATGPVQKFIKKMLRKVDSISESVFACGSVVVSKGTDGVSVYDEDLTLLRSLSHEGCWGMAVSHCGGWVITTSEEQNNVRLWDVNTGVAVACVHLGWNRVLFSREALSRSASIFAVAVSRTVDLYDWSGAALRSVDVGGDGSLWGIQFTPCGEYLVVHALHDGEGSCYGAKLHQYDVATMSCVHVISHAYIEYFDISPCSRVVVFACDEQSGIATRHLYPHNSE